jgi:large subunit ribosomal protein L31
MKKGIHPETYRNVAFKDITSGKIFVLKSTIKTDESIEYEGKKYPLFIIDTSSASHPFYTGSNTSSKLDGRVERFKKRFAAVSQKK